jgi:hypothetical protein
VLTLGHYRVHEVANSLDYQKDSAAEHSLSESHCHSIPNGQHAPSYESGCDRVVGVVLLSVVDEQAVDGREDPAPEAEVASKEGRPVPGVTKAVEDALPLGGIPGSYSVKSSD